MSTVKEISDKNFEQEVLEVKAGPVLVDFWAPWCGPCRMMAPVLEEVATKYDGKLQVKKLNVDENPNFASKYNIRSIPTMIIFKEGKPVSQQIGYVPVEKLSQDLEKLV